MSPDVTAAAIGVAGTVIVGLAGFGAAIWTARRTAASARENRVWRQRARAYIDTIAATSYRQLAREFEMRGKDNLDDQTRQSAQAWLDTHQPPVAHDLEARLLAFGSAEVNKATKASTTAHREAIWAFEAGQANAADRHKAADKTDNDLSELIRKELQGDGQPLGAEFYQWESYPRTPAQPSPPSQPGDGGPAASPARPGQPGDSGPTASPG
jgi:hypothetical protein